MEERRKPFWKTIPGVLTQIAGVVTALAAIGGAFTQLGLVGGDDTKTNAKAAGLVSSTGQPQIEWATNRTAARTRSQSSSEPTVCAQEPY